MWVIAIDTMSRSFYRAFVSGNGRSIVDELSVVAIEYKRLVNDDKRFTDE